jgi:hypothetical protein
MAWSLFENLKNWKILNFIFLIKIAPYKIDSFKFENS